MVIKNVELQDVLKLALAIVLALVLIEFVFALTNVFLIFFTAVILAIAVERPIDTLEKRGIARGVSTFFLYALVVVTLLILLYLAVPPLAVEFRSLLMSYPVYSEALLGNEEVFQITPYVYSLSESLVGSPGALLSTLFKTFGSFGSFLAVFFIAFFLNAQTGGLRKFVDILVPQARRQDALVFYEHVQERVGGWLWGKFLSSLLVGFIIFIGLLVLGIPYALTMAVLAFFLNFIPFVGPIIAAIPAMFFGLLISGIHAMAVGFLYFFVNGVLESFVFGPLLMRRAVQISPALLILFVVIGASLGGVLGIIIAIPTAAIINLAIGEYIAHKKGKSAVV